MAKREVSDPRPRKPPVIIGVAGGTGSGKTTLSSRIVQALPPGDARVLQHDWYYRDRSHLSPEARQGINFDEPDALENELLGEHLRALKAGETVACPQYDFLSHTRSQRVITFAPCPAIVVEGILLFAVDALRDLFDLRIFVDTDDDIRLLRRMTRDIQQRGRDLQSVAAQYLGTVRPMHQMHVAPSKRHAHIIVPEGGANTQALDVIASHLRALIVP